MWWWFWLWVVFIVFLIALPWGYGTGYRRWGPPYPRYYRDPRGRVREVASPAEHEPPLPPERRGGWGWYGDAAWLFVLAAIVWIVVWAWAY